MADLVTSTGVLIGYGSVGRRHAAAMAAIFPSLAVVEVSADARDRARMAHPGSIVASSVAELDERVPWTDTTAVLATWGPSHASLFHEVADRGVRHVLCEKPLASSIADADRMVARADREQLTLVVNHYLRYTRVAAGLRAFADSHDLGAPVALVAAGGAACLATNGIHWVDFACELFAQEPERVTSTAYGDRINPRAPGLLIAGGSAVWGFGNGREAVLSFSNHSSIAPGVRVYFRDAVADLDADAATVRISGRDREALAAHPAVTRCGPPVELLFDGRLPDTRPASETMALAVREAAGAGGVTATGRMGATAVSAIVGALIAGREQTTIQLPLPPDHPWRAEQWPIS